MTYGPNRSAIAKKMTSIAIVLGRARRVRARAIAIGVVDGPIRSENAIAMSAIAIGNRVRGCGSMSGLPSAIVTRDEVFETVWGCWRAIAYASTA